VRFTKIFFVALIALAAFLRFYHIDQIPHGLYIDEVSIGYNAYTILHTGKDEYGIPYPLFFRAFGEYKMPMSIYLTSLAEAVFGKTEFAVRFPSAFFGTATVLLLYFFVKTLFADQKNHVAFLATFLLTISPMSLQFSRGGFEANIAVFFYLLGGYLLLLFRKDKKALLLFFSFLGFIVAVYTYNAYKLISPLTIFASSFLIYKYFPKTRNVLLKVLIISFLLLLPLIIFSLSANGSARFIETSAFSEFSHLTLVQKIVIYPMIVFKNYLSYFALSFLFVTGDGFGRHGVVGMGPFFRWELPFLLAGFYYLIKKRKTDFAKIILFFLLVSPLTASFTRPSPHVLRSLLLVIPLTIIVSYGLVMLWHRQKKIIKILIISLGMLAVYEFVLYLHLYYVHYPLRSALDWGAEYKQVVLKASQQKKYSIVVINTNLGMVGSYVNFYNPKLKYQMIDNTWKKPKEWQDKKILYITSSDKKKNFYLPTVHHILIDNIYFPNANHDIFAQFWQL